MFEDLGLLLCHILPTVIYCLTVLVTQIQLSVTGDVVVMCDTRASYRTSVHPKGYKQVYHIIRFEVNQKFNVLKENPPLKWFFSFHLSSQ